MKPQIIPIQVLQRAFPGLDLGEAQEMVEQGEVLNCPAGTVLCREGAFESTFYIVLDGEVKVTKQLQGEDERLLNRLRAGDFFGEMAILHQAPRAATVATMTESTLLCFPKEAFSVLLERNTSMSLAMVREVSRRLRENDDMAISDLRLKAKELAEAYQHLAEQDYARREFLTTIAHELRTPLMAANGFVQVIRTANLQGDALKSGLETVARNLQDIITLTNDILFLQEMDLILPAFEPGDVGAVVAACVEALHKDAQRNRVGVQLTLPPDVPTAMIDPKSLGRAIQAILHNAIKFSPEGGEVVVEVGQRDGAVWVRIEDHGVGIPPEALPQIFDRFFHLDQVGGHLFRGVGLGLSVARAVIEQHHGRIEVRSTLGQGSVFTVWLNGQ